MRMSLRSSLFLAACAACNSVAPQPTTPPPTTATSIPVPLTAASQSIATPQQIAEDIQPPWTLTASDGSGLLLSRVDAKAVFEGPLAYTELHLYFYNDESRIREGTFQITLPQNAAVSRFAMENNGQWMEAEVVEKQLARRAYDDFLHRKQDPALLEKAAGNQFTAKVFPIAPKAEKHIVISYSQELPGAQYQLLLRGLPKTERVDVSLMMTAPDGKQVEQKLTERNWQPDRDFVSSTPATAAAVRAGNLVAAQVPIGNWIVEQQAPRGVTLLVDTSASRSLGYAAYVASVQKLVASLGATYGKTMPVQVIAFDQDVESIYSGDASGFTDTKKLIERGAAGASNLSQALAYVRTHQPLKRVVVVTDGVITAGEEGEELQKQVKALPADRIDFVLAGGLRDEGAMTALVRTGLPNAGTVLDLDRDPVAKALGEAVILDVAIDVPGAAWVYPRRIAAARAGTQVMVYARMPQPTAQVQINVGQGTNRYQTVAGTQPLVERAVASAEINEMEAALSLSKGADAQSLKKRIAEKSLASRVISSQTSMLVLESDADYARYGIDRKSLADVLVVGANGIERKGRTAPAQIAKPVDVPKTTTTTMDTKQIAADKDVDNKPAMKAKNEAKEEEDFDGTGEAMALDEGKMGKRDDDAQVGASLRGASGGSMGPSAAAGVAAPPPPMTARPASPTGNVAVARDQAAHAEAADRRMRAESLESESRNAGVLGQPLEQAQQRESWPPPGSPPALTGEMAAIRKLIDKRDVDGALAKARDWHAREPGNVLALIALGDSLEAKGSTVTASRVYGSIIDLFPGRADMRRFAGERLARLSQLDLMIDTYKRAVADRPDHLTGHRLLAYAYERAGKHEDAFKTILNAMEQQYRNDSYRGAERVLAEDAGMLGAAYAAASPNKRADIIKELHKRGLELATKASTRFILYWETDANDVDFHIQDAHGGHAFYSSPDLPSGGSLYADITTGFGPECFAIEGTPKAGPYRLSINYYSQGPMGYGMGLLEIQRFDGKGGLAFEDRPYVIMNDHAYVDLGKTK